MKSNTLVKRGDSNPFAASDHNPEIVGLDMGAHLTDIITERAIAEMSV